MALFNGADKSIHQFYCSDHCCKGNLMIENGKQAGKSAGRAQTVHAYAFD